MSTGSLNDNIKGKKMAKFALISVAALGLLAGCSGLPFIPFI